MAKSEGTRIQVYGNFAVAVGTWVEKGTHKGEPFDNRLVYTTTFVKQGGEWKIVSDQVSPIAK